MTWEELVEKVKKLGLNTDYSTIDVPTDNPFIVICFESDNSIWLSHDLGRTCLYNNKSFDRMYAIITALTETKE